MRLTSTLPTARAAALMETAAKHFAHKVAVDRNGDTARVAFPTGIGIMQAGPDGLALTIEAADETAAEGVRAVLEGHLLRFAHRDNPAPLVWRQG